MKTVSSKVFQASPSQLWTIISNPGNMPAWNPKCLECSPVPNPQRGAAFTATFQWKGRRHTCNGDITTVTQDKNIAFRMHYENGPMRGYVVERFELKAKARQQTELRHEVDFSEAVLPVWVKLLIAFLGRFGKKTGPDSLDNIEDLIP